MISKFVNFVTRLAKEAEVTWSEMDTNLNKLKDEIIDQSVRNDSLFDKSITFESNAIGLDIDSLTIRIPLKNSDSLDFVEGSFIFEGLMTIHYPQITNWYRPIYFKTLFYSMDYPGLTSNDLIGQTNTHLLNSGFGLLQNYSYEYIVDGYHSFVFKIDHNFHIFKNYKFTIKLPDNDFNNGIYDLANATITENVYVDPNTGG